MNHELSQSSPLSGVLFSVPQLHELSSESEDEGENTPTDLDESPGEDEDSSDEMFSSLTADVLSSLNMTGICFDDVMV